MNTNPKSRRFKTDKRTSQGWHVWFHQTVNGKREGFSGDGVNRAHAIANALKRMKCLGL